MKASNALNDSHDSNDQHSFGGAGGGSKQVWESKRKSSTANKTCHDLRDPNAVSTFAYNYKYCLPL